MTHPLRSGGAARAADPVFPNIVGTWSSKSEGTVMVAGKDAGAKTHWKTGQTTLTNANLTGANLSWVRWTDGRICAQGSIGT